MDKRELRSVTAAAALLALLAAAGCGTSQPTVAPVGTANIGKPTAQAASAYMPPAAQAQVAAAQAQMEAQAAARTAAAQGKKQ
jgi:hypothetical protein